MKIVWSRRAVRHLIALREFISRDSSSYAESVSGRILESVDMLATQPSMGRPGRILGTRELVIPNSPFVIPYRVRDNRLELLAVFHGRQKWPAKI